MSGYLARTFWMPLVRSSSPDCPSGPCRTTMLPLPPSLSAIICISCSPALTSSGCTRACQVGAVERGVDREQRDLLGLGVRDLRAERIGLHRDDDDRVDAGVDELVHLVGLGAHVQVRGVPQRFDVVGLGVGLHARLAGGDERGHVVDADADAQAAVAGRLPPEPPAFLLGSPAPQAAVDSSAAPARATVRTRRGSVRHGELRSRSSEVRAVTRMRAGGGQTTRRRVDQTSTATAATISTPLMTLCQ